MKRASFYWGDGYIVCSLTGGDLEVKASNSTIIFESRSIFVGGLFERLREYRGGQGKNVYVDLAFPLKGTRGEGALYRFDVDTFLGPYGLVYTSMEGLGYYLTIYPPPGSLYDYAVLSPDMLMFRTSHRREIYVLVEDNGRRIILV